MTSQTFFLVFIPILAFILLAVNIIFAPHNPYQEKNSVFECGFHSFLGQNRSEFSISFFIFALLFLLFDLEILLVYPYVVSGYVNGVLGLIVMLLFFLVLTLGFVFELGQKALTIDSKQTSHNSNSDFKFNSKAWNHSGGMSSRLGHNKFNQTRHYRGTGLTKKSGGMFYPLGQVKSYPTRLSNKKRDFQVKPVKFLLPSPSVLSNKRIRQDLLSISKPRPGYLNQKFSSSAFLMVEPSVKPVQDRVESSLNIFARTCRYIKRIIDLLQGFYWCVLLSNKINTWIFYFSLILMLANAVGLFYFFLVENGLDFNYLNSSAGDSDNSKTSPNTSQDTNTDSEKGSQKEPDKEPAKKPKLTLDLSKTDLEKDKERIALCTHEEYSEFYSSNKNDVESIYCDFDNGETRSSGGSLEHKAFDSEKDIAFLCNDCQAIMCKNCVQDYSSDESNNN